MSNTPNMGIPLDIPGSTPGPVSGVFGGVNQWATDNESFKTLVDAHDHSSGKGVQVQPAGLNISSDLSFQGNNATNLRTSRYSVQGSQPSGASDRAISYAGTNGELYWINSANQVVQITSGGAINVSSAGGITGLAGTNAAVTWSPALNTFIFTQAPTQPAALSGGSYSFAQNGAVNPNSITLQSPNSLAAAYTATLPASLISQPASVTTFLTMNGLGVIGNSINPTISGQFGFSPGSSLTVSGNYTALGTGNISTLGTGYVSSSTTISGVLGVTVPVLAASSVATPNAGGQNLYSDITALVIGSKNSSGVSQPIYMKAVSQTVTTVASVGSTGVLGGSTGQAWASNHPFYVPANTLVVGSTIRIRLTGLCTSSVGNAVQLYFYYGANGTTADTNTAGVQLTTAATSGTSVPFTSDFYVVFTTIGASPVVRYTGFVTNTGTTGITTTATTYVAGTALSWSSATTSAGYITVGLGTGSATTTSVRLDMASIELL